MERCNGPAPRSASNGLPLPGSPLGGSPLDSAARPVPSTAFERGVEALYRRLGSRYLRIFRIGFVAFGIAICPLAGALFSFYQPMSVAEYVRMVGVSMVLAVLSLGLAVQVSRRAVRAVDVWLDGARGPEAAAAAWSDALRAPGRALLPTLVIALIFGAIPLTVFTAIEFDYSLDTSAIVLVTILLASMFPTMMATVGTEVALRPLVRETAAASSVGSMAEPFGPSLRQRLLLIFPMISLISAMFVSVISAGTNKAAFTDLGADVVIALVGAGLSTLMIAFLVTQTLVGPIDELVRAIGRFGEGDFAARATVSSGDELGALAAGFNHMADERQRSREELVSAREEERRRLSRDLHDDLGPSLAGIAIQLGAARTYLDDTGRVNQTVAQLEEEARRALTGVRGLVRGLRPPALDEFGLARAIEQSMVSLSAVGSDDAGPVVDYRVEGDLEGLPAAVEVAAFYIAREAVTNAVRHADASRCSVRLTIAGSELELAVTDDGRGLAPARGLGLGLHSMRERATELGGSCRCEPLGKGGTRVIASLPIGNAPEDHRATGGGQLDPPRS